MCVLVPAPLSLYLGPYLHQFWYNFENCCQKTATSNVAIWDISIKAPKKHHIQYWYSMSNLHFFGADKVQFAQVGTLNNSVNISILFRRAIFIIVNKTLSIYFLSTKLSTYISNYVYIYFYVYVKSVISLIVPKSFAKFLLSYFYLF